MNVRPLNRMPLRHLLLSLTLLAFTTALCSTSYSQTATPTTIQVSSTIQQSSVKRLGIVLGDHAYWGSSQILKNVIYGNSGFEGMAYRSILVCAAVSGNTCTDANKYTPMPTNYWKGATYRVISGAAMGRTGTILSSTAGGATGANTGLQVTFDASIPLAVNDYVSVETYFPGNATQGWFTNTSGAGALTTELTDLSPETTGKQALRMTASGASDSASVTSYVDTYTNPTSGQPFLKLNGHFRLSFRAKGVGGANQLTVNVWRMMLNTPLYINQKVPLTTSWADYNLDFVANEGASTTGSLETVFAVAGSSALLDDVSLVQTDSDPDNPTAFRDDVVNTLKTLNPGVIRNNAGASIGVDLYDQIAPALGRYSEGFYTGSDSQGSAPIGIPEFLQLCATVGAEPWITIPTATSPQEMTDFMDYLQGNGSTTYSAIRVSQGQTAPWTSVFPVIHIELGNETWNTGFAGENMSYPAYPLWANQIFGAARQSPGFVASKFDFILSGWSANPYYNQGVLSPSTQHDSIDIAPYILDSANNDTVANIFGALFAEPEMFESPTGQVYLNEEFATQAMTSASGKSVPTKLSVYEENLATDQGTITQAETTAVMPSVGAGIALADHMLQMMRAGVVYQNVFELTGYEFSGTNGNKLPLWGTVVDMGFADLRRPSFLSQALANTAIAGDMLQTVQTGANPTWNQPLSSDNVQLSNAHDIQSFAFLNGQAHSLVLFNLNQTTALPVLFSGPNAPSGTVTANVLTSKNITDNNETASTVTTSSNSVQIQSTVPYSLPPFSMTVLTWTGSGTEVDPATGSPMFSLAAGTYATAQTVTLTDATSGATIYYTTNGTTPTIYSTKYTAPITVSATETIEAIGVSPGNSNSPVSTATYTISTPTATPAFSVAAGTYSTAQSVSLSDATSGAAIYYTTDGTTPTTSSTKYTAAIPVNATETIHALAVASGHSNSAVSTATYTISTVATASPVFSVASGSFSHMQLLTISDTTQWATVYYTTNGTTPTTSSTPFTTSIPIASTMTVKAIAVAPAHTSSPVVTASYIFTGAATTPPPVTTPPPTPVAATPTFSVKAGTYTTAQSVTLSDATAGSTIYYTTNGVAPTTSSTKYTGAITVGTTETLSAIAVANGYTNSAVGTAAYTIQGAPAVVNSVNFGGGFTATGLNLVSAAKLSGTALQLTNYSSPQYQVAAAWYSKPVNVQSFTTDFTLQLTNANADGMTFTIQNQGPQVVGSGSGGLGFMNLGKSVGVKFDLFDNKGEGPNSTGVYSNGAGPFVPSVDLTPSGVNLHSGNILAAHIVYNGTNLQLTITDTVTKASFTKSFAINIPATVGGNTAYVGFTGAAGYITSTQKVLTWTFGN